MSRVRHRFRAMQKDVSAVGSPLLSLIIGYLIILFVSFIMFNALGPDTNAICNDPTNFTADECSDAETARGLFWTILVLTGVATLIAVLKNVQGNVGGGNGGGGGRRRRR